MQLLHVVIPQHGGGQLGVEVGVVPGAAHYLVLGVDCEQNTALNEYYLSKISGFFNFLLLKAENLDFRPKRGLHFLGGFLTKNGVSPS